MSPLSLLGPSVLVACAPESAEMDRVLSMELARRPDAAAADLYKLLHQSVFGPGHLIRDVDAAREYLVRELADLGATPSGEALREDLGGGMVRVNLRPFRDGHGSVEDLVRAMVATAQASRGNARTLDSRLAEACRLLERKGLRERATELQSLARSQAGKGHPALHHSGPYRLAYRPAYRVVHVRFLGSDPAISAR